MFGWQYGMITLWMLIHFKWVASTIYMHRGLGHRLFNFSPVLSHFFRFYLWLTGQIIWKNWMQEWTAQHRKHHRYSDGPLDPHSPHQVTFKQLLFDYADIRSPYYVTPAEVQFYAPDIVSADDWIERNLYCKYPKLGSLITGIAFSILFGWFGVAVGIILYFYIQPVSTILAAWLHHTVGFRYAAHASTNDHSKIVCPFGFFEAGETLHANHHLNPGNPNFSRHWWELDPGWWYARVFIAMGLMSLVEKKPPND